MNKNQARFTISEEMLYELGWEDTTDLVGELTPDHELMLTKNDNIIKARFNRLPRYNLITIPRVWDDDYNRSIKLESNKNGALIVKFFL
ncbi:MAG: hypothetical protein DRH37_00720 [Deltaproteobacteria bacterium]|nr:MAG: hypothetical protein DRH37_00720 [Deltaproteobacteria bacterium]